MSRTISIAPVRKSLLVPGEPQLAFEVFTAGIDRWWPRGGHSLSDSPLRRTALEPFVGGRWLSQHEDGSEIVLGHVLVWEPAARLVFTFEISAQWRPDPRPECNSEVEVRFFRDGDATRVELEHRHFERLGPSDGAQQRQEVDGGWRGLLELFQRQVRSEGSHT
jgi:uncharacterized protein YndB with AHSA1/START domain